MRESGVEKVGLQIARKRFEMHFERNFLSLNLQKQQADHYLTLEHKEYDAP